ncbi:MAG: alanine:cation symporter family protein [Bacteroidales bacterium]
MIAIFLFAFSTMISWSYYGLKGFDYLFGDLSEKYFKNRNVAKYTFFTIFLLFIIVGSASNLGSVLDFSDMMILSLAVPNITGLLILAPEVKRDLSDYFSKLKSGEIKRYK